MAGALRDLRHVPIVGSSSFGKGSVQELESLRGGSTIKVTVARWLTPSGESISEVGITPDHVVEISEEDITAERDPQLDRAFELVNGL